jgi:hypothetical protein
MIHFGEPHIKMHQNDLQDSFGLGKSSKKIEPSIYEKCAFQCVNIQSSLTQQEARCIKACYNKEYNTVGFKDARLYL